MTNSPLHQPITRLPKMTPEQWVEYNDWVQKMHDESNTPEKIARELNAGRAAMAESLMTSRERRLNPDPVDRSAGGRKFGNYAFLKVRGE